MPERAFRAQFFEQFLGFIKGLRDEPLRVDQLAKTAFYLRFSQHFSKSPVAAEKGRTARILRRWRCRAIPILDCKTHVTCSRGQGRFHRSGGIRLTLKLWGISRSHHLDCPQNLRVRVNDVVKSQTACSVISADIKAVSCDATCSLMPWLRGRVELMATSVWMSRSSPPLGRTSP